MSSRGFGPGRSTAQSASGGGAVTGARNGLLLAGSDVIMGGVLDQFTNIDLDGFDFLMNNSGLGVNTAFQLSPSTGSGGMSVNGIGIEMDDTSNLFRINGKSGSGEVALFFDFINSRYEIGDLNATTNGSILGLYDNTSQLVCFTSAGQMLNLSQSLNTYEMGDIQNQGNSTSISILDGPGVEAIQLRANNGIYTSSIPGGLSVGGSWLLGGNVGAVCVLDATQYLEIAISGTIYKIALIQ